MMATLNSDVTLWQTPSGKLHQMRNCSGGATTNNTTEAIMTDDEVLHTDLRRYCRCAHRTLDVVRARNGWTTD